MKRRGIAWLLFFIMTVAVLANVAALAAEEEPEELSGAGANEYFSQTTSDSASEMPDAPEATSTPTPAPTSTPEPSPLPTSIPSPEPSPDPSPEPSPEPESQEFVVDENGVLVAYNGEGGYVDIPSEKNGITVTTIGTHVFDEKKVSTVDIPSSVTSIEDYAFYNCQDLKAMTVPQTVKTIGEKALGYQDTKGEDKLVSGFSITGYSGTAAESYAFENNIPFHDYNDRSIHYTWKADPGGFYRVTFTRGISANPIELTEPVLVTLPVSGGNVVIEELISKRIIQNSIVENGTAQFLVDGSFLFHPQTGDYWVRVIRNAKVFVDVDSSAWYKSAVDFVSSHELFKGVTSYSFNPRGDMTRAMLVTVLYRLAGSPQADGASGFSDVPAGTWYSRAVAWAVQCGIAQGVGEGKFAPDASVTRQEMATFLWRYQMTFFPTAYTVDDLSRFADRDLVSGWARESVGWAVWQGIIQGRTTAELAPYGTATRAEVAVMLGRMVRLLLSLSA